MVKSLSVHLVIIVRVVEWFALCACKRKVASSTPPSKIEEVGPVQFPQKKRGFSLFFAQPLSIFNANSSLKKIFKLDKTSSVKSWIE